MMLILYIILARTLQSLSVELPFENQQWAPWFFFNKPSDTEVQTH